MDYYAGVTFGNVPDDKKISISWMSNWFYATKVPTEVWRSAMTLPRELSLKKIDGQYILTQKIVDQIEDGIKKTKGKYEVVVDRVEAIEHRKTVDNAIKVGGTALGLIGAGIVAFLAIKNNNNNKY